MSQTAETTSSAGTGSKTTTTKARGHLGPNASVKRRISRIRRHARLRKKIAGTPARPRLVVTRSSRHIVAQVIDDIAGHTLAQASSMETDVRALDGDKKARAAKVGELVAQRAGAAGVGPVVFDRGGRHYHGRIAQLADAAREGGLTF